MSTHLRARPLATLLALPLLLGSALAGEAPLTLPAQATPGGYVTLPVPLALRAMARSADLGDLQVLNARGESVPFAWADEPAPAEATLHEQPVAFFSAPAAASAAQAALQGGWIIDARQVSGELQALQLQLPAGTQGVYSLVLERSDDLQQWQTLQPALQLLSLQHQGQWLQNTRIELAGTAGGERPGYLRLRPQPGSTLPPLAGVRLSSVQRQGPALPLQWTEEIAPTDCSAAHCDYQLPRHLPLARIELRLAAPGVLAPLQWLAQDEADASDLPAAPQHRHHPLRDHLKGLRDKSAPPAAATEPPWYPLLQATAYWLRLPEGELQSPALPGDGASHARLRLAPQGGMAQLGSTPPKLRVATPGRTLVFLAREPAPFRLAWGGADATALALPQLMPGWHAGQPLPGVLATVATVAVPAPAPAMPASPPTPPAAPPEDTTKPWLWAVLLLALALMGGMAWSLLRPGRRPADASANEASHGP